MPKMSLYAFLRLRSAMNAHSKLLIPSNKPDIFLFTAGGSSRDERHGGKRITSRPTTLHAAHSHGNVQVRFDVYVSVYVFSAVRAMA